jgi:hypothetical protein
VLFANGPFGGIGTDRLRAQIDVQTAAGSPPGVVYNDGRPLAMGMYRFSPIDIALRVNGIPLGTAVSKVSVPDVSGYGVPMYIGAGFSVSGDVPYTGTGYRQALDGVMSEVVIARDPSDAEVRLLESYLMRKYALPRL